MVHRGYETTANALAYTIFLLAQHPRQRARLLEEIAACDVSLDSALHDIDVSKECLFIKQLC